MASKLSCFLLLPSAQNYPQFQERLLLLCHENIQPRTKLIAVQSGDESVDVSAHIVTTLHPEGCGIQGETWVWRRPLNLAGYQYHRARHDFQSSASTSWSHPFTLSTPP